jgi:hypothetical protein
MFDALLAKLAEATLSPNVIATLIAAMATLLAAFIQLRISWRRDQAPAARSRKTPEPAKPRRAPTVMLVVLAAAAAVGGFTAAMFLIGRGLGGADDEIRAELRQRVAQLTATADRLEQASVKPGAAVAATLSATATTEPASRRSIAAVAVAPCRLRVVEPAASAAQPCTEADALRVALCAAVPLDAGITQTATFLRDETNGDAWTERRVAMGEDAGSARFAEKPYERSDAAGERHLCVGFWSWHAQHTLHARLVVDYTPPNATAGR